jgi:hypothetical protein
MRALLFFACAFLLPIAIGAQSTDVPELSDYAWGFPIETGESASFYSVELPLEVNQSVTNPALRDAGVYNGDGSPVPRMFAQAGDEREPIERSNPLPTLPLFETVERRPDEDGLVIEREGDSTQFKFDLGDLLEPAEDQRLVEYIVDTRQTDDIPVALDLVWAQMEPGFMGRVMVDGGNDLQIWSLIGSAVVAYLREDAASIEQRRVRLRRGDFDFLRLRWEGLLVTGHGRVCGWHCRCGQKICDAGIDQHRS